MRRWHPLLILLLMAAPPAAAEALTYHGLAGRVAEYRMTVTGTGEQVSLEVRRPVRVEAEYLVREEVVSVQPDGSLWLLVSSKAVKVTDQTGAFGATGGEFPAQRVHVSRRGEVLEAAPVKGESEPGMRARAAAVLTRPQPVILPEGPAAVGATWEWEKQGGKQTNRLEGMTGGRVRIATSSRTPLGLQEASAALGLTAVMSGEETEAGTAEFSSELGLMVRHKGNGRVRTKTQVSMEAPDGRRTFTMALELRTAFEEQLVRVDGKPV